MVSGLYAIVDLPLRVEVPLAAFCEALVAGGARTLQVRAKGLDDQLVIEAARLVVASAGPARVVINDRIEVARALGLWVHVGQEDWAALDRAELDGVEFGLSTHSLAEIEKAADLPARYLGFGPVYGTESKPDAEPTVGVETLREAAERSRIPLVAIGGITPQRAQACARAGAAAVACISGLLAPTAEGVRSRAEQYVQAFGPVNVDD